MIAVVESVPLFSGIEMDDALSKNKIQPVDVPGDPAAPVGPVTPEQGDGVGGQGPGGKGG